MHSPEAVAEPKSPCHFYLLVAVGFSPRHSPLHGYAFRIFVSVMAHYLQLVSVTIRSAEH